MIVNKKGTRRGEAEAHEIDEQVEEPGEVGQQRGGREDEAARHDLQRELEAHDAHEHPLGHLERHVRRGAHARVLEHHCRHAAQRHENHHPVHIGHHAEQLAARTHAMCNKRLPMYWPMINCSAQIYNPGPGLILYQAGTGFDLKAILMLLAENFTVLI